MHPTIQSRFTEKFPGPYCYRCGVDEEEQVFDLCCIGSQCYVVSTSLGEDELVERVVISTVAVVLNDVAGWQDDALLYTPTMVLFKRVYFGPFTTRLNVCPDRGPYFDVCRTDTQDSVVHAYVRRIPGDASMIAENIARALNVVLLGRSTDEEAHLTATSTAKALATNDPCNQPQGDRQ